MYIGPRPNTTGTFIPYYWVDDTCDCDQRCQKCGKLKRPKYPQITYTGCSVTSTGKFHVMNSCNHK